MRSLLAAAKLRDAVQTASVHNSMGRRVLFAAGHLRAIATQVIDPRRLPVKAWTQPLQNASGQFYWRDDYSHPNGGDIT
jgi:hypothetical protein